MSDDVQKRASSKQHKQRVQIPNKVCLVCGDTALGFNFNAVSCESCKSFFRRNARRSKTSMGCPYDNQCIITVASRRRCKQCRLRKCIEVGMRKDLLPPEDSMYTPALDNNNRKVGIPIDSNVADTVPKADIKQSVIMRQPSRIVSKRRIQHIFGPPIELAPNMDTSRKLNATTNVLDHTTWDLPILENNSTNSEPNITDLDASNLRSSLNLAIGEEIHLPSLGADSPPIRDDCVLTNDDHKRINDLYQASVAFFADVENKEDSSSSPLGWSQAHVCERLRRVIEVAKSLPPFKKLNENDQIALIKGGAWEMHLLRSLLNYNPETQTYGPNRFGDYWSCTKDGIYTPNTLSSQLVHRFLNTVDPQWCDDKTLILIMIACCMFTSTRPNVNDINGIKYYEDLYRNTLYRYLLSKYRPYKSRARYQYVMCMQKLQDLGVLNRAKMKCLQSVAATYGDSLYIDPLLTEIFGV